MEIIRLPYLRVQVRYVLQCTSLRCVIARAGSSYKYYRPSPDDRMGCVDSGGLLNLNLPQLSTRNSGAYIATVLLPRRIVRAVRLMSPVPAYHNLLPWPYSEPAFYPVRKLLGLYPPNLICGDLLKCSTPKWWIRPVLHGRILASGPPLTPFSKRPDLHNVRSRQ
jgi:hypothetical protein